LDLQPYQHEFWLPAGNSTPWQIAQCDLPAFQTGTIWHVNVTCTDPANVIGMAYDNWNVPF
jgi:hypothetical protein